MRKIVFMLVALIFIASATGYAANVAGDWVLSMSGPQGTETIDMSIDANNTALTITGTHSVLGEVAGTGTIDGDVIEMTIDTTGGMGIGFIFEGIVSGNEMSGTRELNMGGTGGGGPPGGGPGGGAPPDGGPDGDNAPAGSPPGGGGPPGGGDMGNISDEWTAIRN